MNERPGSAPEMHKVRNEAIPLLLDLIAGKILLTDQRVSNWHARYMNSPRQVVVLEPVKDRRG